MISCEVVAQLRNGGFSALKYAVPFWSSMVRCRLEGLSNTAYLRCYTLTSCLAHLIGVLLADMSTTAHMGFDSASVYFELRQNPGASGASGASPLLHVCTHQPVSTPLSTLCILACPTVM